MYHFLICDDEAPVASYIEELINQFCVEECIQTHLFSDAHSVYHYLTQYKESTPPILFMDVLLSEDNGVRVTKTLKELCPDLRVVFVSGTTTYLQDAFDTDPLFYLVKPIQVHYFKKALEKVLSSIPDDADDCILVTFQSSIRRIPSKSIVYVESRQRQAIIHCHTGDVRTYDKLRNIQEQLPDYFISIHKSYIVNLREVQYIEGSSLLLFNGTTLPISRSRYQDTKETFFRFLGGKS